MAHNEIVRAIEEAKHKISNVISGKLSSSGVNKIMDILDEIKSKSARMLL